MPKYKVIMTRDTTCSKVITVEADNPDEAESLAYDEATESADGWESDDWWGKPYCGDPELGGSITEAETEVTP